MSIARLIFESWSIVLPGMLLLEIALFVLTLYRNRYIVAPVTVGILGVIYSALATDYYSNLKGGGLLGYLGECIVCYYAIYGFAIFTVIFGVVFAIVHSRRQR